MHGANAKGAWKKGWQNGKPLGSEVYLFIINFYLNFCAYDCLFIDFNPLLKITSFGENMKLPSE
jgi:hypothetical protein